MIYIKNTTETQTIFIPRNELQKEAYITSTKTYEDGYREGLEDGKEQQKDQLLNLYITENGQYEREDGWGTVTVDIPIGDCPECEDCSGAYDEGYNQGYEDGQNSVECPECEDCSGAYDEGYEIGKNEGYNKGFADGQDAIECPIPNLGNRTIEITNNGETNYNAEIEGLDGWKNVKVKVNVPTDGESETFYFGEEYIKVGADNMGTTIILNPKEKGFDGYSKVTIDVENVECPDDNTIKSGTKLAFSTFEVCPYDVDGQDDYIYFFYDCKNLKEAPRITVPIKNTSGMFSGCSSLETAPSYNTTQATDISGMYGECTNLVSVGALDCSSLPSTILGWDYQADLFGPLNYTKLTDFGGLINLKMVCHLDSLVALNEQSVLNIFNGLYDFIGNGQTPHRLQGNLYMSSRITDLINKHKHIAEAKGWTITIE